VTKHQTPVVRGLIHDQDGNPIPDATILLGYEEGTPSTARSGPNGEFVIADMETPPPDATHRELVVDKAGWCLGGTGIGDIRSAIEPIEIELQPSKEVNVRILTPDGTPVSDAVITPQYVDNERGYFFVGRAIGKRFLAKSDREGCCQFPGLARLGGARVDIEHPDHGTQDMYFASADLVELTLRPVGRIVGQVTAEDPGALCGLEIQADSREEKGSGVNGMNLSANRFAPSVKQRYRITASGCSQKTGGARPLGLAPDSFASTRMAAWQRQHRLSGVDSELALKFMPFGSGVFFKNDSRPLFFLDPFSSFGLGFLLFCAQKPLVWQEFVGSCAQGSLFWRELVVSYAQRL